MKETLKQKHILGAILVIFAAILWSLDGLLRQSLYALQAAVSVFYEHLLCSIVILPFFLPRKAELSKLERRDWGVFLAIALFSGVLGTIFYTAALGKIQFIQYSVVVLLQQLQPLFAITLAGMLLKEKITPRFLAFAGVAVAGAYLVSFPDLTVNLATGGGTALAALLALGAAFFWGSATVFSKHVLGQVSHWVATAVRFFLAVPLALLVIFATGGQSALTALSQQQVLALLGIVFSTGLVAMLVYYYGLQRIPAKKSTIYELAWPLSAIVLDYLVNRTVLTVTQLVGAGLILFSMYQISVRAKDVRGAEIR